VATAMIRFNNVTKIYGEGDRRVVALQDVDLEVKQGEIFGIIGLSGAGKSTLIRCINKLEVPQSGAIEIGNRDITQLTGKTLYQARREIGMIFQHFNLLANRTVFGNIAYPLEIAGVHHRDQKKRVEELAELVGLSDKLKAYPSQLSGGQKQRVGIARALANHPKVLLCDEATSALDPETTKSILNLLLDVNQCFGLTIVLITHEINVIKEICDTVAVIENGRIVEQGPVAEIFTDPNTDAARGLIKSVLHTDIPDEIKQKKIVIHRPEWAGKMVHIFFIGEVAGEPIITSLIRKFNVDVNIIYANLDSIKDTSFGSLVVVITGSNGNVAESLQYLTQQGLKIEVLNSVEPATLEPTR
jgi:D-methionine transport system ATP-binding protein